MNIELLFNKIIQEISLPIATEEEFIRIEKRLKLEEKLNSEFNKNDLELILKLLNENSKELNLLYNNKGLLNYLLKKQYISNIEIEFKNEKEINEFKKFIENYFTENILDAFNHFIELNKFSYADKISIHLKYLPSECINRIELTLINKLDYAISVLNSNFPIKKIKDKILFIENKYFFQFINKFRCKEIDTKIIKLINTIIDRLNDKNLDSKKNIFKYEVFIAMKFYNSFNESLKEVILNNYKYAISKQDLIEKDSKYIGLTILQIAFFAVLIYSFFADDNKIIEKSDNRLADDLNTILTPRYICCDSSFMCFLNDISKGYINNQVSEIINICLESEFNLRNIYLYDTDSLSNLIPKKKIIKLELRNLTDKICLIYIQRDCKIKNSLIEMESNSIRTISMLSNEKFKILLKNRKVEKSSTFEHGFGEKEAKLLISDFYISKSKEKIAHIYITDSTEAYSLNISSNILIM